MPWSAHLPVLLPSGRGEERGIQSESRNQNQNQTTGSQIRNETCLLAPRWAWRPLLRRRAAGSYWGSCPARWRAGWARDTCSLPEDRSKVPPGLGAALRASLERSPRSRHLLLGLLLPICFSPCYVPRFDFQRKFPQGLLCQVVAEVIEEVYDVIISSDIVVPVGGLQSGPVWGQQPDGLPEGPYARSRHRSSP